MTFLNIQINLTPELIILNNYDGKCKHIVNTLIAIMKQFIYASKCFEEKPTFLDFMTKLSYWFYVDKIHAYNCDKVKSLHNKWQDIL